MDGNKRMLGPPIIFINSKIPHILKFRHLYLKESGA
jgi:hypothetical protein